MANVILRRRGLGLSTLRSICSFSETGLRFVRNDRLHRLPRDTDMIIRWGCTSRVPVQNVLNSSEAIQRVNNKAGFRFTLNEHGLCPPTFASPDEVSNDDLDSGVVIRTRTHERGNNFYIAYGYDQAQQVC